MELPTEFVQITKSANNGIPNSEHNRNENEQHTDSITENVHVIQTDVIDGGERLKTQTISNHNSTKQNKEQNLWKFMYVNIRGIKGKMCSLIEQIDSEKPAIFLLTETLLSTNANIQISGYTFFGRARNGKSGGGVGVLVREDIRNSIIPHLTERNLEIIWISIRRKNKPPFFVGCYYGKQESRVSKEEIDDEMRLLSEEIEEFRKEGNIIIFMDGNGKLGLLGEQKS